MRRRVGNLFITALGAIVALCAFVLGGIGLFRSVTDDPRSWPLIVAFGPGLFFAWLTYAVWWSGTPEGEAIDREIKRRRKAAQPSATDNPDDAQRLREDH